MTRGRESRPTKEAATRTGEVQPSLRQVGDIPTDPARRVRLRHTLVRLRRLSRELDALAALSRELGQ